MRLPALLAVALSVAACSTMEPPPSTCVAGKAAVETQLYFGLGTKTGEISAREWQRFVEREIAPRFPEGFSIADVRGAWLGAEAKRTISENSKLLVRVHDGTAADNVAITAIIDAYKRMYAQESVMRVDSAVCVAF